MTTLREPFGCRCISTAESEPPTAEMSGATPEPLGVMASQLLAPPEAAV